MIFSHLKVMYNVLLSRKLKPFWSTINLGKRLIIQKIKVNKFKLKSMIKKKIWKKMMKVRKIRIMIANFKLI